MTLYDKIKIYENSDLNALYYENKSVSFDNLLINISSNIAINAMATAKNIFLFFSI